jgi:hypothetical protein
MRLTVGTGGVGGGPISTSPLGRITCVPGPEPDSKAWSRVGSSIRGSSGASEGVVAVGAAGLANRDTSSIVELSSSSTMAAESTSRSIGMSSTSRSSRRTEASR